VARSDSDGFERCKQFHFYIEALFATLETSERPTVQLPHSAHSDVPRATRPRRRQSRRRVRRARSDVLRVSRSRASRESPPARRSTIVAVSLPAPSLRARRISRTPLGLPSRSIRAQASPRPFASTCPPRLSHPRGAPTRLPPTPPRATRRRSWRAPGRLRWRSCVARDASRSGERKKTRTSRPSANLPIATRPESRRKRGPFLKTTPFRTRSVTSHSCVCAQSSPREPRPPRVPATRRRLSRRR